MTIDLFKQRQKRNRLEILAAIVTIVLLWWAIPHLGSLAKNLDKWQAIILTTIGTILFYSSLSTGLRGKSWTNKVDRRGIAAWSVAATIGALIIIAISSAGLLD